jgi:cytochrome c oxidase cbb3-type subunit 4
MDIDGLRIAITLVSFIVFIGIVLWAWSKRNKAAFAEAADLPFTDDDSGARS